jgi:FAD:protein FMN transferase
VSLKSRSFPALGTTATLCVTDPEGLEDACAALEMELEAIDAACSRFRADSELSQLNARAGEAVAVGEMLFEAVTVALHAAHSTGGIVDPTIGRSLRLAGYDRSFEQVHVGQSSPPRFVRPAGWRSVEADTAARTVRLCPGTELDLGATAKALAADHAAASATAAARCGVLVSLGGDVAVAGPPPKCGWPILIADDHAADLESDGPVVSIRAGGLATSGTSVRRWRAGKVELHHIFDPTTGGPAATRWRTVTVAAASCVDANVASTAAVVLGDDAPAWLASRGLPARLVTTTGETMRIDPWPAEAA